MPLFSPDFSFFGNFFAVKGGTLPPWPPPPPWLRHCYQHGASNGGIRVCPVIKITDSSHARVTCIYCSLKVKINMCKKPAKHARLSVSQACVWRSWVHFVWVFPRVVGKVLNTSDWSLMADDAITASNIGGLESPFYICELLPLLNYAWSLNHAFTHKWCHTVVWNFTLNKNL